MRATTISGQSVFYASCPVLSYPLTCSGFSNSAPLNANYHPHQNKTFAMVISDGFLPFSYWNDFMPPSHYQGVIMSVYGYQVWTDEVCVQSLISLYTR